VWQHSGIAALDLSFTGGEYGVYHSVYDSFHWMDTYGDPSFAFHKAAADLIGTMAIMLASDAVRWGLVSTYQQACARAARAFTTLTFSFSPFHFLPARRSCHLISRSTQTRCCATSRA